MPVALPLKQLAARVNATLFGNPDRLIDGVAELGAAGPGQIAPFTDPARLDQATASVAGALLVSRRWQDVTVDQLVCDDPRRALARCIELFATPSVADPSGIDPRAALDPTARVDPRAWVGPFAFVGAGARVGAGSRIEPFSYVGAGVSIGNGCRVGPHAVVMERCAVADGSIVGPGAVIGHAGFGYYRSEDEWKAMPSVGRVEIGERVEIGANSCVDRGTLGATRIGAGSKIDNLVQVGHNSTIGARALLCAQVGLAGSVELGDDVVLAGQVGVADRRKIGAGARVGGGSGVARDVAGGDRVTGYPALAHARWLRGSAIFARLGDLAGQIRQLERRVAALLEPGGAAPQTARQRPGEDEQGSHEEEQC